MPLLCPAGVYGFLRVCEVDVWVSAMRSPRPALVSLHRTVAASQDDVPSGDWGQRFATDAALQGEECGAGVVGVTGNGVHGARVRVRNRGAADEGVSEGPGGT